MYKYISRDDCYYTDTDSVFLGSPLAEEDISSTVLGQLLHRAEVVVDQAVIGPGLGGELARRDLGVAALNEQAFRRVEERLFGVVSRVRNSQPFALR
jgi:hypothetical protein